MDTNGYDFAELALFITGPTFIRDEVKEAGVLPEFGHRDKENDKRFGPIRGWLKELAGAGDGYETIIYNGSGSTSMESSIRSLVADDETVLNVSVGAFGDLYHKMAVLNGKKAEQLKFDYGLAIDLDVLADKLKAVKPAVVTFTHNETSTGVRNDIKDVCAVIREHGAMPLVDGVSIFGGFAVNLDEAGPAMYCTSTQKALALPAGFGIGFVNQEAEEKAAKVTNRGHASCILNQLGRARKNQTLTTPNCTLANQMYVQMDYIMNVEGAQERIDRHLRMRDIVHEWVRNTSGCDLFAQKGHRSPTLTTVMVPEGVTLDQLKALKETMRGHGYLYDPGYGKLNAALVEQNRRLVFRVGHMGDINEEMLETYLNVLGAELAKL